MSETQNSNKIEFFKTMLLKSISVGHSENKAIELIKISAPKNKIELLESDVSDIKLMYLDLKSNNRLKSVANKIENFDESANRNNYIAKMMKDGLIFADINDEYNYIVLDDKIEQVSSQRLSQMQQSFGINISNKIVFAKRFYHPRKPRIGQDENGIAKLNSFVPPKWAYNHYFFGEKIKNNELPECYSKFLSHLFPEESNREYVLDWLSNSLHRQNLTYLCLIGEQGVGKGLFSYVARKLHGERNSIETSSKTLNGEFSGELLNRTLAVFDELQLQDEAAVDRLKSLVNPEIRIESKGKDAQFVDNFLNVIILSNRDTAIPLEGANERRYSFVNLTETPIRNVFQNLDVLIEEMNSEKNIEKFAQFLYHRQIKNKMNEPFKSEASERILYSQLKDWERTFIEYIQNYVDEDEISIERAQEIVSSETKMKSVPGRDKFKLASERSNGVFQVLQKRLDDGSRKTIIKILKKNKKESLWDSFNKERKAA